MHNKKLSTLRGTEIQSKTSPNYMQQEWFLPFLMVGNGKSNKKCFETYEIIQRALIYISYQFL